MHKPVVEVDTTIAAPTATVWKAMKGGAMFPGTEIETDWQIGHPIVFKGEWKGKSFEDHGEILSANEGSEISFTHWSGAGPQPDDYHIVRYALSPAGDKTRVNLTQANVGPKAAPDQKTKDEFTKTFQMMLDGLKASAEAG